jgi:hypothetical protein
MRRTPIIAGNWKMNTLREDALALVRGLRERADGIAGAEKIVCPPFVFLHDVRAALAGSTIAVGAQNAFWEEKGAYTGEVSIMQVAEAATHVILGHSERRQYFGETDDTVNRRVKAALAHGVILSPALPCRTGRRIPSRLRLPLRPIYRPSSRNGCHCEAPKEPKQSRWFRRDRHVAGARLLAMTAASHGPLRRSGASR